MKNVLFILLLLTSIMISGQVIKRSGHTDWIQKQGKILSKCKETTYKVAKNNILDQLTKNKQQIKNPKSFFSISAEINIAKDGKWEDSNDTVSTWTLLIESPKAEFLSLIFDEFEIPKGDEIVIYNPLKTILMGPFTDINNPDGGSYAVDIIEDDSIILEYHRLKRNAGKEKIKISNIIHGISKDLLPASNSSSSSTTSNCHVNATCSEGDGWDDQRNATIFILRLDASSSEVPRASGVLVNNSSQDNTPYILTAEHVTKGYGANTTLWIMRFKYWVNDCNGNINSTYISYSGAQLLEKWNDSDKNDIALLKMLERPRVEDNIYYSGLNIASITPSTTTCLSHPFSGDNLMKIAKSNSVSNFDLYYWKSDWYLGGATGGSSGAPVFDQSKCLVGIHHGRINVPSDADSEDPKYCGNDALAGKLLYSWNNSGLNGYKLSKWLDPNNNGNTSIEGKYRCEEHSISQFWYNYNQLINGNKWVTSGCKIILDNIIMKNNQNTTVYFENTFETKGEFSVPLGAVLEVN